MKKKTAILLVSAICAASVAVGVAAKGVHKKMQKTPKSEIELYDEDSDSDHIRIGKSTKRPESESVDTSRFITEAAAKQAALDRAEISSDSVSRIKAELDFDDGKWKYEVDFRAGRYEYEVEIDAENGSVLKFEKEYDD